MQQETKPFAWSISRLSAYELCPKRHHEVDLKKTFEETPGPEREFGTRVHKALEEACRDGKPLPPDLRPYQDIVDKVLGLPGHKTYEQRMGIDRHFQPCGFFDPEVWLRVVADVLVVSFDGDRAAVVDYKTGKIKPDMSQLKLNAAVIFATYPRVFHVDVAYWWVAQGKKLTRATYSRVDDLASIWNEFLNRVNAYESAYVEDRFPATPSGICKRWCPVRTCEFHGGGSR
jgi:hypothetical protein